MLHMTEKGTFRYAQILDGLIRCVVSLSINDNGGTVAHIHRYYRFFCRGKIRRPIDGFCLAGIINIRQVSSPVNHIYQCPLIGECLGLIICLENNFPFHLPTVSPYFTDNPALLCVATVHSYFVIRGRHMLSPFNSYLASWVHDSPQ